MNDAEAEKHAPLPERFYERSYCGRHIENGRCNEPLKFCQKHQRHYCPKCGAC